MYCTNQARNVTVAVDIKHSGVYDRSWGTIGVNFNACTLDFTDVTAEAHDLSCQINYNMGQHARRAFI